LKPFSIICKSCAVRLKVTRASAIDQLLACPKCGTMIKVVPPKGWVIPQRESSESKPPQNKEATLNSLPPSAADSGKATDSNFDFEDIDQLLAQPGEVKSASQASASLQSPPDQQASVETGAPEKKTKRSQVAETSLGSATDSARPVDPMLPNQQWESDESKSKKRLVRTLALVLGTVLLGGFILALTIANRNKPPIPVAENAVDDDVDEVNKDAQPAESQDDIEPKTVETEAISKQVTQNPPSPTSDTDPEPDPSTSIAPTAPPQLPGTATQLPTAEPTTADPTKEDPSKQSPQLPSPFRNAETEAPASVSPEPAKQQSAMGMVAKIENQMGDLAGLLEKSGASLSDLRDVAFEASGQTVVGMPKYVIEKPGTMKTDLARLDLNVGGLLLEDTPLPVVVRELTSISGVPITIDARSIEAAGVDVNQPISLTITDSALNTAMDQILTPLGIVKQTDSVGLKFTVANSLELELASYSLAEFADLDEQAKKSFLAYIQAMIDPQIWVRDLNPATIELQGDDIVVSCPAQSHTQIKRMVAKLKSANALIADPTDPAAMAQTLTRSGAIISPKEIWCDGAGRLGEHFQRRLDATNAHSWQYRRTNSRRHREAVSPIDESIGGRR